MNGESAKLTEQHADEAPAAPTYNPCADGHPAKLWEALRRNKEFQAVAEGIVRLAKSQLAEERFQACRDIWQIRTSHPFAATALEWLGPQPTFRFTHCQHVDGTDQHDQPCKFDLQWEGTTPGPPPLDDPAWRVMDDKPKVGGHSFRVGPTIWQSDQDKVDSFQKWREDAGIFPPFNLTRTWPETPKLFRWDCAFRWRHFEHGVNPHTGRPDLFLSLWETGFFQGWDLRDFDRSKVEGLARTLQFDQLAGCRVFAVPKLRFATAKEIDDMLREVANALKAELVCRDDILGTETQWKVLLTVEANRANCARLGEPFSLDAAIDEAGEALYADKYDVNHRREIVLGYYRAMDADGADPGWTQRVFPQLPPEIFPNG